MMVSSDREVGLGIFRLEGSAAMRRHRLRHDVNRPSTYREIHNVNQNTTSATIL
ncbi:MAG: hypothetical protein K2M56_01390 [Muribaculaceae bacterium]|nr:hypothetical protein [Muribaculaceae bacterium]